MEMWEIGFEWLGKGYDIWCYGIWGRMVGRY